MLSTYFWTSRFNPRQRKHSLPACVYFLGEFLLLGHMEVVSSDVVCRFAEAAALQTILAAQKSLACFLLLMGALLNNIDGLPDLTEKRFPIDDLHRLEKPGPENKDASDTEDDDEDDGVDEPDDDDDAGDEDFSAGEEGGDDEEGDPEGEPEANGNGGSGDDEDDDDDDEDDDVDEDEGDEDEGDEEEEDQPPAKKRK